MDFFVLCLAPANRLASRIVKPAFMPAFICGPELYAKRLVIEAMLRYPDDMMRRIVVNWLFLLREHTGIRHNKYGYSVYTSPGYRKSGSLDYEKEVNTSIWFL
jgi:hypothetical protein